MKLQTTKPTPEKIQRVIEMKLAGRTLALIRDELDMTEGQVNDAWRAYRTANPDVPARPTHNVTKRIDNDGFMHHYTCEGLRGVRCNDKTEAANIFADRLAKKKYGRTAYARTLRINAWNSTSTEYGAFVGVRTGNHETTGSNIHFTVHTK